MASPASKRTVGDLGWDIAVLRREAYHGWRVAVTVRMGAVRRSPRNVKERFGRGGVRYTDSLTALEEVPPTEDSMPDRRLGNIAKEAAKLRFRGFHITLPPIQARYTDPTLGPSLQQRACSWRFRAQWHRPCPTSRLNLSPSRMTPSPPRRPTSRSRCAQRSAAIWTIAWEFLDSVATAFQAPLLAWKGAQQVMLVLAQGPIPSFAPPYVPLDRWSGAQFCPGRTSTPSQ